MLRAYRDNIFAATRDAGRSLRWRNRMTVVEPLEARRLMSATLLDNVALTDDPDVQQMPSVAADPHATGRVAVAYMDRSLVDTGYAGIAVASSEDGGQSWTYSSIPLPAGYEQGAAQPIAKFDDEGRLYVTFLAGTYLGQQPPITNPSGFDPTIGASLRTLGFTANTGIFLSRSDDGGHSWGQPVAVSRQTYDGVNPVPFETMPELTIDTFRTLPGGNANPNYGNVYVVWTRFYPSGQFPGEPDSTGGSLMQIAVSGDHGLSFASRPPLQDTFASGTGPPPGLGNAIIPKPTVGPEGDLYVAYYDFGNYLVLHSDDAAQTFSTPDFENAEYVVFNADGNAGASTAAGPDNRFRTQVNRVIVADPARPGVVYAAEPTIILDEDGRDADTGDVYFARSLDHGKHWEFRNAVTVGGRASTALNDDNFGRQVTGQPDDVAGRQFFSRLAVDDAGNLAAIWYDTRRDPSNRQLDVFGTVSTDGGRSFAPNFRVTNETSDPRAGVFTDPTGHPNNYLGDLIGLSVVDGVAYMAWTDTRNGNQDVFFSSVRVVPVAPPAPNDRFEPNDSAAQATVLDPLIRRILPKLALDPDDADVFSFTTLATGQLTITATQELPGARLRLELFDATGGSLLAASSDVTDGTGMIIGQRLAVPSTSGKQFTLRVTCDGAAQEPIGYQLDIRSLTAELGTLAHDAVSGAIDLGDENYYSLTAVAAGTLRATLATAAGSTGPLALQVLDPDTLEELAAAGPDGVASAVVQRGQPLLVRVAAAAGSPQATGAFALELTNFDAFASDNRGSLLFPAGDGPSQLEAGDMNGDGRDDLVVTNAFTDTLSVLLANDDGSLQAPRQYAVGAFVAGSADKLIPLNAFRRDLVLGDFNADGNLDVAVANTDSADVSILLGRGDGTLQPQRRFDAVTHPFSIDAGDLNADGLLDLAVMDVLSGGIALLLGRGDGTFRTQSILETGLELEAGNSTADVKIEDVNADGRGDVLYTGAKDQQTYVRLGAGDGTTFALPIAFDGAGPELRLADLDGDGDLDAVNANFYNNSVSYALGDGEGHFETLSEFDAGQAPVGVVVADLASPIVDDDGNVTLGAPDGIPDIITAASGTSLTAFQGPAAITISPGSFDEDGVINYGDAIPVAGGIAPLSITLADADGDGTKEIAFVDTDGVRLIFQGAPDTAPNTTPQTARNLGTVVHLLQPTLTIVPGREDAWYTLTLPTEAARGSGDEVLDLAANFEQMRGAGLQMEVLDSRGNLLVAGERVRLVVAQGQQLLLHIVGRAAEAGGGRGYGAYTLDADVLPRLLSVEAPSFLPGVDGRPAGPTSSLVLTFQGDRLDQASAEDPANYTVTYLGRDGIAGTRDDRVLRPDAAVDQPVVYNPSANVDISTGRQYATAVRQTVTLQFANALPPGSYRVTLSPHIVSASFNANEPGLLGTSRHPVVSADMQTAAVSEGVTASFPGLVRRAVGDVDVDTFRQGTSFLSQLHGDLGALLDQRLSDGGDQAAITPALLRQILTRIRAGVGDDTSVLALFLDPVGIDLQDPAGQRLTYDLKSGEFANGIGNAFVSVASNVELVVIPLAAGQFTLNVNDVPATARGGVVILDGTASSLASAEPVFLTDLLRSGQRTFQFDVGGDGNTFGGDGIGVTALQPRSASPFATSETVQTTALGSDAANAVTFASFVRTSSQTAASPPTASSATAGGSASLNPSPIRPGAPASTGVKSDLRAAQRLLEKQLRDIADALRNYLTKLLGGQQGEAAPARRDAENKRDQDRRVDREVSADRDARLAAARVEAKPPPAPREAQTAPRPQPPQHAPKHDADVQHGSDIRSRRDDQRSGAAVLLLPLPRLTSFLSRRRRRRRRQRNGKAIT